MSMIQTNPCDDVAAFSLREETPTSVCPGGLLGLAPTVPPQGLLTAVVALLHHRGSYSVILGNRTGMFQSPRQMPGFVRWRVPGETDSFGV
jgi:hypothetical protein